MTYDYEEIAKQITEHIFGINDHTWMNATFSVAPAEGFLFKTVYDISQSHEIQTKYPEVLDIIGLYPAEFIQLKAKQATQGDTYFKRKAQVDASLDGQADVAQIRILRRIIYNIHMYLLQRDYGDTIYSWDSECRGLTREAEAFIEAQ